MTLTAKKLSLFKHTYVIVSRFGDSVFIIYKVSFCLAKLKNLLDSKWFKTESTLQEVRPVDFRYLRLQARRTLFKTGTVSVASKKTEVGVWEAL